MTGITSIDQVFGSFSNRARTPKERKKLTKSFRTRVTMLCAERHPFSNSFGQPSPFWSEIHAKLRYLMGKPRLSYLQFNSQAEDVEWFLEDCTDENFLDFIEFVFQSQKPISRPLPKIGQVLPSEVNHFLNDCELPYFLTDYIWETKMGEWGESNHLVAFPQIITRDSEVIHEVAIEPTILLLRGTRWKSANDEFLKALQCLRKQEWGNCVTRCANSLESVMKIVCKEKGWENDPDKLKAARLLRIVIENSSLDPYYSKLLELPHVLRNERGEVHGTSEKLSALPEHIANFAVNMTASTILLMVEEAGL